MNITSYFQEITKEHLIRYSSLFLLTLFLGCNDVSSEISKANMPSSETSMVSIAELELKQGEGLFYYKGAVFSGTAQKKFSNKEVVESIDYQYGKRHGTHKKMFENGAISYVANYKEGKKHGTSKSWWRNGNLRSESNFQNGIVHGTQKQWYQSGALFKELQIVDGKEQGLQKAWRENGKLFNNYEAKNGRIFGLKRGNLCYELDDQVVKD